MTANSHPVLRVLFWTAVILVAAIAVAMIIAQVS